MTSKTLLILANSFKHRERCIAGRELVSTGGKYTFGPWVRPVSNRGHGELDYLEISRSDGSQIKVLDFAIVGLQKHAADALQPENWLIEGQRPWRRPNIYYKPPPLTALEEHPENLWLETVERTDQISHERLLKAPPGFSICVIRPEKLELSCWTEYRREEERHVKKYRAKFAYHGVNYCFSLTDPMATEKYCNPVPEVNEAPRTIPLQSADGPLICVSLTPLFKGFHYKIVATILGMPP